MKFYVEQSGKKKYMRKRFLFPFLLLAVSAGAVAIARAQEVPVNEQMKIITRLVARQMEQKHYRQQPLDREMSSQIFDAYFNVLDPERLYFSQADLAGFEPQRYLLADELKAGNYDFAFAVFDRFLTRFEEYRAFAGDMLKQPIDFTADESYALDRRQLPRPDGEAAQKELWRLKVKNDVLYFKLIQRAIEEDSERSVSEREAIARLWDRKDPAEKVEKRLHDLHNFYTQRERIDVLSMYLTAVTQVYGPHSGYQPPKQDEDFRINMSLSLSGIGATLTSDDGYIRVVSLVPGGPAAASGRIHVDDRIIAVTQDGGAKVGVIDMPVDNAVKLIRGPADSKVTLTVLSGKEGRGGEPQEITLVRKTVNLQERAAKGAVRTITRADGRTARIGVVTLPSFYLDIEAAYRGDPNYRSCTRDVKKILENFKAEKVDAVVMDLRGNSGGSLPEGISLTGLFITSGPVVQVRYANRQARAEYDEDSSITYEGPLVVLTSKFTASSAEIFAGAIRDYRRGVIVGDSRTFGKGTVLNVVSLKDYLNYITRQFDAGSLRIETAMFFRVNGESVQQLGVRPDIVLPSLTEEMEVGEMFSENHLPWDSIAEQSYRYFDRNLPDKIPALRLASEKRVAEDPEYGRLIRRIEVFKEQNNKKIFSLNEQKRWDEYKRDKAEADLNAKAIKAATGEDEEDKTGEGGDPILDETLNIAADFAAQP